MDIPDGKAIETNGTVWTDANGDIIVKQIWTIPSGDYVPHDYRVDLVYEECNNKVYTKKDSFETISYTKEDNFKTIPEFPTVAIPAVLALGGYLAIRIRSRKD